MSKRLKNYTPPDILINEYGADALRLYLINSNLLKGEEQRFADSGVKEMVRRTLLPWLNAFKFLQTYAQVDKWHPDKHTEKSNDILDCWIYSRCQSLKTIINAYMADYKLYYIIPELLRFIDELTNWYIRLNRHRFWEEGLDHDKCAAYSTLYEAVYELTVCMAPFAPFLAETLYQGLMQLHENNAQMPLSVHLCAYPEENKARIDTTLEEAVDRMQQIILLGRQRRNQAKIKIKTPLKKLTVIHKNKYLLDQISKLEITLKKELNIKEISYETNEEAYIHFYAKPNSPVLGKRFGNRFPEIKKQIEALSQENLSVLETTGKLVWNGELFEETDILIFREAKENKEVLSNRYISISLDLTLNQDLKDEGLAREIVNNIQKSRKELGLHVSDRITIVYQATGDLQRALEKHTDLIAGETLALEIKPLLKKRENMMRYDIEEESMYVWIEKIF